MTRSSTQSSAQDLRAAFDRASALTVGVEEELLLLDPETLDLAPRAVELLARTGGDERFKLELPAAQIEIVSPPFASVGELEPFLAGARRDLAAAGEGLARLAGAGVHPFAATEGEVNPGERYDRTLAEYGRVARRQLVFALQVHVAVPGADRALAVYNALRSYLPELLALSANAPFHAGEDTGLATVRPKIGEQLPRQGVPPAIASFEDYAAALAWGERAGTVHDPRVWWWELRPHPVHGTIEVRVPDAQTTVRAGAAVAAVVHALVAWLAARHDAGEQLEVAPTWRIEENRWAALSRGVHGRLADLRTGELEPTRDRLLRLIDQLTPLAADLGCAEQLAAARELTNANGADQQRAAAGDGGDLLAVTRHIADRFLQDL
ncbi:MAG: glutamate---cysteine ligase / carboxylate-amine ligase [Thermoleophilaceae bacterium]|jgi:carboxylate-amine ligase|nr:glutamate---cysteine ligase / carboxylate-amine ligase [Thermoleophilaceae bacterium]